MQERSVDQKLPRSFSPLGLPSTADRCGRICIGDELAHGSKVGNADGGDSLLTALVQLMAVVADPAQRHAFAGWQERIQTGLRPEDRTRLGIEFSQLVEDRRLPDPMRQLAVEWTLRLLGAGHGRTWDDAGPAAGGSS